MLTAKDSTQGTFSEVFLLSHLSTQKSEHEGNYKFPLWSFDH